MTRKSKTLAAMMSAALVVAAIAWRSSVAAAQASQAQPSIVAALMQLKNAVERLPEASRSQRLVIAMEWLERNAAQADPAQISEGYVRSMQRAAQLLVGQPAAPIIDDVMEDLEAKVDHCRMLGVPMGGQVNLKVNTRRTAGEVKDWQVFYLLKFYERLPGVDAANFPRLSTPTEVLLEPGRYWVWAKNPATGQTSERSLVRVAGQKEVILDLPVP